MFACLTNEWTALPLKYLVPLAAIGGAYEWLLKSAACAEPATTPARDLRRWEHGLVSWPGSFFFFDQNLEENLAFRARTLRFPQNNLNRSITMGIMSFIRGQLIEIIEWTDDSRDTISFRFEDNDAEIKRGAQLIVRESQVAQFVSWANSAILSGRANIA